MITLDQKKTLPTDEALIHKIVEGETALFEILIRRYNSLLYKIARTYGLNHQDAEDMMQETHFAAYTQLKNFRGDASFKTWITKIILNKCYHKISYGNMKYEDPDHRGIAENTTSIHTSSGRNDTEKTVLNKELAGVLEQSIQNLPMPYRSVFVLREMEGFSVAETSELLNITATNVKVRLNRAKAMLQNQIERFYSSADLFEFHLVYCDNIVKKVFEKINAAGGHASGHGN